MSPLSGTVLGAAALVASPAMWAALTGSLPLDVALTRYLIAAVGCWMALSVVAELVSPGGLVAGPSDPVGPGEDDAEQPADPVEDPTGTQTGPPRG